MSKELKRFKDWFNGYSHAVNNSEEAKTIFADIENFIDSLIREGEIAEHEAKKVEISQAEEHARLIDAFRKTGINS